MRRGSYVQARFVKRVNKLERVLNNSVRFSSVSSQVGETLYEPGEDIGFGTQPLRKILFFVSIFSELFGFYTTNNNIDFKREI